MEAQPAEELAPVDLTEMEVQPAEELAPVVDWAAGLPFECHLYLLSFAPLACLGRCTAVCRSWRSLNIAGCRIQVQVFEGEFRGK